MWKSYPWVVSADGTSGTASDLNPDDQELASHQETFFVVLHFSEEWRLATFKPGSFFLNQLSVAN